MKISATIQVRMGSKRLPRKALKKIVNKTLLEWQIERLKRSLLIDEIIIATSKNTIDDILEKEAKRLGVKCFRGSENDVLERVNKAVNILNSDINLDFFGDSPFVDPFIIDQTIGYLLKNYSKLDFVTTALKTTYSPGLEVTAYKSNCITKAHELIPENDPLREHTGQSIIKINNLIIENLEAPRELKYPNFYFEIDTKEDYLMLSELIQIVVDSYGTNFSIQNLIKVSIQNPNIIKMNIDVERRWKKYRKN